MPIGWIARHARYFAPALILLCAVNAHADCKGKYEKIPMKYKFLWWEIPYEEDGELLGIIYDNKEVTITKFPRPNDPTSQIELSNRAKMAMSEFRVMLLHCLQGILSDAEKKTLGFAAALPSGPSVTAASRIAGADLNGDGNGDFVSVLSRFADVSVWLGRANGTHNNPVIYPTGANPTSVLIADFDKDGKLDLAVAHQGNFTNETGHIAVLLGNGDGTFRTAVKYTAGVLPSSLAVGDFNGDGRPDLAVSNSGSQGYAGLPADTGSVSILLGKGDGTFGAASRIAAGDGPASVLPYDLNNDQKTDLIVANRDSGTFSVLRGNGDGTFQPQANTAVGPKPAYLGVSDLNGDAVPDIIVLHSVSATLSVWLGQPNAAYQLKGRYLTGVQINSFAILDFEADPRPYLLAPDAVGTRLLAYPVHLDGALDAPPAYIVGTDPRSASVADFDRDGELDVVVASSGQLSLLRGRHGRTLQEPQAIPLTNASTGGAVLSVASGDFDGDGRPDIAILGANRIAVLKGLGNGTFQAGAVLTGLDRPYTFSVLDVNGDGKHDIVSVNQANLTQGNVTVFLGSGNGSFQAPQVYATGNRSSFLATGDLNKDGRADLVVVNKGDLGANKGTLSLLLSKQDGTYLPAVNLPAGESPESAAMADFNGDGLLDISYTGLASRSPNYIFAVTVLPGKGDGTFLAPVATKVGDLPGFSLAADFDRDGRADLIVSHCCGQTDLALLRGRGDGTFEQTHVAGGADPVALATGDFDQDGRLDLVVVDNAGGRDAGAIAILFNEMDPATHVSAASFETGNIPPNSIASAFGNRLASGMAGTPSTNWPETLAGTAVRVRDRTGAERPAKIAFAGPGQVNYLMPPGTAEGQAVVTITSQDGTVTQARVGVQRIGPGVFFIGNDLAAAFVLRNPGTAGEALEQVVELDAGSQIVARPIDLGSDADQVVLLLFATGIRGRASESSVEVTIGGVPAQVLYAGPQGEFPGLDQINVLIPKSLRGRGLVNVEVVVEDIVAKTVKIRVK